MYQGERVAVEMLDKKMEPPILQDIADRISKQNSEYSETLNKIDEKLHAIFNTRTPEKSMADINEVLSINDFYAGVSQQLSLMQTNNNRLQKVLDHLKRIVG